jgi:glycosyltransferase involved in cell wall biosynthesis
VSVIVPARNEEASLRACLESLVAQSEPNHKGVPRASSAGAGDDDKRSYRIDDSLSFEIIVVDDGSTDRTRAIAESFPGVRVIQPGPLPPNWTGKNNAVTAGARAARGEWLLFTDADTVHKPGSLALAVAEAEQHKADLLSYSPEQEVYGFWEKAVMPVIFAELAETYPPSEVSDPGSSKAAANGQYLLISRVAYDAVGGHAAVADSLLEDVALARLVKQSGRRIFFRFGGEAVRTRMYRSWPQLIEGWTKNLKLLFSTPRELALNRLLEFMFLIGGPYWALCWLRFGGKIGWSRWANVMVDTLIVLTPIVVWTGFLWRLLHAHFSLKSSLVAIPGLPIFAYLLLRSSWFHRRGKIAWKGRTYTHVAGTRPLS